MKETAQHSRTGPRQLFRRPSAWRDNIEGILSALVLVLIVRHFVFEVFKIPTGSMAPTLVGKHHHLKCPNCGYAFDVDEGKVYYTASKVPYCPNCSFRFGPQSPPSWRLPSPFHFVAEFLSIGDPKPGNRVIVNKFVSRLRAPRRWSVVVFLHPTRKVNYIKRLVGLPGEEITIEHGDVFAGGRLLRKPDRVQEDLWQLIYDSSCVPKEVFRPIWQGVAGGYTVQDDVLELKPATGGRAEVRFRPSIRDFPAYNGLEGDPDGWCAGTMTVVGDLKWDVSVLLDGPGGLFLHLREDGHHYTAVIRFGDSGYKTALLSSGKALVESDLAVAPGRTCRIAFSNVDDRLALYMDGKLILDKDVPVSPAEFRGRGRSSGASLEVNGRSARFTRVRLFRDIYYTPYGNDFSVPENGYFVLGDNTRCSSDSRYWGSFPKEDFIGNATVVWWPPQYLRAICHE